MNRHLLFAATAPRWPGHALLALLVAAAPRVFAADDAAEEPSTTPYRPSVSTPASLSAPGWLEIEAGLLHLDPGSGAHRDSVPATFKLAFTPDWGVRVGGEPWVALHDAGGTRRGFGDSGIVLKRRSAVDEQRAFGLEAGLNVPTAGQGLGTGSGKPDYSVNTIYSADFAGSWHTDLNLLATRLGQADPRSSRLQMLWAAALSRSFGERWGAVAELSGTGQHGAAGTSQFLLAATCNVSGRLTLDAGMARSTRSGPPAWSAFTGLTWLAARLF